jgi:glucose-6-phosphate isomerase
MRFDFQALAAHQLRLASTPLVQLCAEPDRSRALGRSTLGLHLNLARQRLDPEALQALLAQASRLGIPAGFRRLVEGEQVNPTEARPALHTALRSALGQSETARAARAEVMVMRQRMEALSAALEASTVTDIVSVGIGGSDLGPRLVVDALREVASPRFRIHFLTNVDGSALARLLPQLDRRSTAVLLVSKSFTTQETLLNGQLLREWLGDDPRLFAVTAHPERAAAFGVAPERVLPMWDWVGGRFSLWSAVGWSIRLALGSSGFDQLLAGAAAMDAHALESPLADNLPVLHALVALWNRNLIGLPTQAVLPYDERLALLPAFLQQLVMESLGKRVRLDGSEVLGETVPVVWGGTGTNSQHSFFQALHQGSQVVPCDFIGVLRPAHGYQDNHRALLSNLLAQCEALASGSPNADPHRHYPGDRPSSLLLLDQLDPHSLGALLALYEHSVYVQALLWGINAFDQWGVELGKQLASQLLPAFSGGEPGPCDAVTRSLLAEIRPHLS